MSNFIYEGEEFLNITDEIGLAIGGGVGADCVASVDRADAGYADTVAKRLGVNPSQVVLVRDYDGGGDRYYCINTSDGLRLLVPRC